jgi:hypothetical protein
MGGCTPESSARAHRFSHKTHTRVMKFPEFVQLFFNRLGKHCADQKSVSAGHN